MHKIAFLAVALTVLALIAPFTVAFADVSVGVKKGDWIEYQVTIIGTPPPEYNITWGRMEVTGVQGEAINVSVQTRFANGTLYPEPYIPLNLATGAIGDGFFAPVNINVGEQFYGEYQGNITITSIERMTVVGAERTVVSGTANPSTYYWDRQTGIMVAATSDMGVYTISTRVVGTNLWQPQIFGLDLTVFYALITAIVIAIAAVVGIFVWHKKMHVTN